MRGTETPFYSRIGNRSWMIPPLWDGKILRLAVAYLLIPYIIFFAGWLRLPIAVIAIGVLVVGYGLTWLKISRDNQTQPTGIRINQIGLILAIVVIVGWLLFSGAGHFADQVGDYKKHNLILGHLINQNWPIIQHLTLKDAYILVYYIGYYLPAGAFGKAFGFEAANIFQFFYTLLGLVIAFYFFLSFTKGKYPLLLVILFILFGGMDVPGWLSVFGRFPVLAGYIGPWSQTLTYQGNSDLLFFVPQQAIPAWIAIGVVLWCLVQQTGRGYVGFIWALTLLWAPWIFLGLAPIMLWFFLSNRGKWREFLTFTNIIPLAIIGIIMAVYYSINKSSVGYNGWIWSFTENWLSTYLLFVIFEFLLLGGLLLFLNGKDTVIRPLLLVALIPLLLIPFFHSGVFNDFCMRASIPSLTILALVAIRTILNYPFPERDFRKLVAFGATILVLLVGSIYGVTRIGSSIQRTYANHGGLFYSYSSNYEKNLFDSFNNMPSDIILEQYLARNVDYRKYQWLFKY